MKKILASLIAFSIILTLSGSPLTPDEALARIHSAGTPARVAASLTQKPRLVATGSTSDGAPAYYIFSGAATTLFVSGDDMATPLLGYADGATADDSSLPPQLLWWLEEYSREIEWARAQQGHEDVQFVRAIDSEDSRSKAPSDMKAIAPLLTTTWNQDYPYNIYTPVIGNEHAATGCVATAMAQVMNYYEWPQAEVPPISYEYAGTTLTSPAMTLKWDNMADDYSRGTTAVQRQAVARLMQVVGYSVQMMYGTAADGGSAAYSINVRPALVDIFGYDIATELKSREFYATEEWTQMIYDNLNTCGPIYYDGNGTNGAHAFVCDGYDGMGKFHFNWGWGGAADGYFVLSALNPGTLGIGGGAGGFNYQQNALIGLRRPVAGSTAPVPFLVCNTSLGCTVAGRTITFSPVGGGFFNYGVSSATFTFGTLIESVETGEVYNATAFELFLNQWYGITEYSVNLPATLAAGLYKVYPAYRVDGGLWKPMTFSAGYPDYTYLSISGGEASIPADEGAISVSYPYIMKEFVAGDMYDFTVTVGNLYATAKKLTLEAYICTLSIEDGRNLLTAVDYLGAASGTIPGHGAVDFAYTGTLRQLAHDEYYLVYVYQDSVVDYFPVDVDTPSGVSELRPGAEGDTRYFNLEGVPTDVGRLSPGVYIIRQGTTTRKELVK